MSLRSAPKLQTIDASDIPELYDAQMERLVLGAMMLDNSIIPETMSIVKREDYFFKNHRQIRDVVLSLHQAGMVVDYNTVNAHAKQKKIDIDIGYVASCADDLPDCRYVNRSIESYRKRVIDLSHRRKIRTALQQSLELTCNGIDSQELLATHKATLDEIQREITERFEKSTIIEWAPDLLRDDDPPDQWIVPELLPEGVLVLMHGDPRTRKSFAALELVLSVATGTAPFGLTRFTPKIAPAWYIGQEDGRKKFKKRLRQILKGKELTEIPRILGISIHKNLDFDSEVSVQTLIEHIEQHGIRLLVIDPIRRFTKHSDKGPSDVKQVTDSLRRIIEKTGVTIIIVHHDIKPGEKSENRKRSHRASGGDWFASSECPIAFESAGRKKTLVIPEDYKFSEDPAPFSFEILDDLLGGLSLIGNDEDAAEAAEIELYQKISDFLEGKPHSSGAAVQRAVKARKDSVHLALEKMHELGKVDCAKKGRSNLWFLCSSEAPL